MSLKWTMSNTRIIKTSTRATLTDSLGNVILHLDNSDDMLHFKKFVMQRKTNWHKAMVAYAIENKLKANLCA